MQMPRGEPGPAARGHDDGVARAAAAAATSGSATRRQRATLVLLAALVGGAACDGEPRRVDPRVATAALGQPSGDFPSYAERVVLYASNRARMNPAAEGWPLYPAQPPLQWNLALNQSSRAHSIDMRDTPCFQHPSCGSATDDTFTRVQTYYTAAARALGENIAGGPADGITVVHNWIFEIGAAAGETGHRDNLFSAMFNLLGAGFAPGGMPRPAVNNFWTQDFVGPRAAITLPKMTDGVAFPAVSTTATGGGAAGPASITFGTTYYDPAGAAPSQVTVMVDGTTCTPLALATAGVGLLPRGTAGKGAYEATIPLAAGCHSYLFIAGSGSSASLYPDSGALQVAVGAAAAADCPSFIATAPSSAVCGGVSAGTVDGGPPSGGAGGDAGSGGQSGGHDAGGQADGVPTAMSDAGRAPGASADAGSAVPPGSLAPADAASSGASADASRAASSDAASAVAGDAGCACDLSGAGDRRSQHHAPLALDVLALGSALTLASSRRRGHHRGPRRSPRRPDATDE